MLSTQSYKRAAWRQDRLQLLDPAILSSENKHGTRFHLSDHKHSRFVLSTICTEDLDYRLARAAYVFASRSHRGKCSLQVPHGASHSHATIRQQLRGSVRRWQNLIYEFAPRSPTIERELSREGWTGGRARFRAKLRRTQLWRKPRIWRETDEVHIRRG